MSCIVLLGHPISNFNHFNTIGYAFFKCPTIFLIVSCEQISLLTLHPSQGFTLNFSLLSHKLEPVPWKHLVG